MTPLKKLLERLPDARRSGNGWSTRCPAHKDRRASLSISEGEDGRVLVKCHAGCDMPAILAAVDMHPRDLYPAKPGTKQTRSGNPKSTVRTFRTANDAVAELERRHGKRTGLWTYHDAQGKPVGVVVRFDMHDGKEYRPVTRYKEGWRIEAMPSPRPLYGLPDLVVANRVIVCEGEKAADAARSLGFVATTSAGGSQAASKTDWEALADKEVWIMPDNDDPGRKYANTVASILAKLPSAPTIQILELPDLPDKGDIVDWISVRGDTVEPSTMRAEIEAMALAADSEQADVLDDHQRMAETPTIYIGTDEYRVNEEATAALAREQDIYQRGGLLVHVLEQPDKEQDQEAAIRRTVGAPVVRELARPLLRERLSRCARWIQRRSTSDGEEIEVPAHPPDWSIGAVHARGSWPGVRRLDAVVTFPVMLRDGSLLATNGYHRAAGVLVNLPSELKLSVPDRPNGSDIQSAVKLLFDPLQDFPFETQAHKSALLAGLLTPLAWFLFDGPAPLFLIDKNVRGAGAGLLADVVALTVAGRRFPVMSYTNDREELRKRITTLAMEGERLVLLDNLAGAIGNDILDAALTADHWKDRVLGGNRVYDGPLHVVWFATGNNVQLHADTSRRVCHVRMESKDERPELRTGFRYPNLRQQLTSHRSDYLSAALTILRGWILAGRPKQNLLSWGSFEGWSDVVRETLVFAGLPDPGETRMALQSAADRDAAAMADIIQGMIYLDPTQRGLTTADIVSRLRDASDEHLLAMRSAVEELCGKLDGRLLAIKFRSFKRRNFNGWFIDIGGTAHGTNRWVALPATSQGKHPHQSTHLHQAGGDGGDGGLVSPGGNHHSSSDFAGPYADRF